MFNNEAKVEIEMLKQNLFWQMLNYFKQCKLKYSLKTPDFTIQ